MAEDRNLEELTPTPGNDGQAPSHADTAALATALLPGDAERLKRKILHDTVADNVALIEGLRLRQRLGLGPRRRDRDWRWAVIGALLLALTGTSFAVAGARVYAWLSSPTSESPDGADAARLNGAQRSAEGRRSRWADTGRPVLVRAPERFDPSIFPLQVRRIVLDPGHGGEDHGTMNRTLSEKDITLDIAQRLRFLLEAAGFEVTMTREDDRELVLRERSEFANRLEADLFVSIHINWISTRERGVETYFLGPAEDPELAALARRENQGSGYSLADQDNLIRGVILNAQHDRSRHLASRVQQSLFRSLLPINPTLRDRGVKTAPFVVLVATEMPAILAEVSCLSNREEAELLARPLYREHIADALARGIRLYADDVSENKGNSGP